VSEAPPPGDAGTGSGPDADPETVAPPAETPERDRTVAGVLLAAGTSTRFGDRNKLLATVDGRPVVRHAAATLREARVGPVTVVVGHEADRVRTALEGLNVSFVENSDYRAGQATSVRTGVATLRDRGDVDAAVIALGDMPFVAPGSVDALVDAYLAGAGDALAAAADGDRGNPVLFDARYFEALTAVEGDVGGRAILLREGRLVETDDPGVRRDVDTPEDLSGERGNREG